MCSRMSWQTQLRWWYKSHHRWDQAVIRYWIYQLWGRKLKSFSLTHLRYWSRKWICSVRLEFQRTSFILRTGSQSQCTILMIARGEKKKKTFAEEHTKALSHSLKCSQSSQAVTTVKKEDITKTSHRLDLFRWLLEDQGRMVLHLKIRKSKHRVLVERLIIRISSKIKSRKRGKLLQKKMKMKILPKVPENLLEKRRDQDSNPKKEVPKIPNHCDKVKTARSEWEATRWSSQKERATPNNIIKTMLMSMMKMGLKIIIKRMIQHQLKMSIKSL
jgi:hypothetical protein